MRRGAYRSQRGITLIELLVSIIVMGILSTMIIGSWMTLTDAYSFTSRSNKHRDFAREAISRMAREIRDAQAPAGGNAFAQAGVNEIRFYSTFNVAGAADPTSTPTLTRYILRNGTIFREKAGPDNAFDTADDRSTPLVRNVVNATIGKDLFTYYYYNISGSIVATNGAPPPNVSVIQAIGLNLYVDENPGKSPNYFDVNTTVRPRNLGSSGG
jgi:prepilin-type N-terminal cleavage/methylation domain-containing protein